MNRLPSWALCIVLLTSGCGPTAFQPIAIDSPAGTFRFTDLVVDSKFDHLQVNGRVVNETDQDWKLATFEVEVSAASGKRTSKQDFHIPDFKKGESRPLQVRMPQVFESVGTPTFTLKSRTAYQPNRIADGDPAANVVAPKNTPVPAPEATGRTTDHERVENAATPTKTPAPAPETSGRQSAPTGEIKIIDDPFKSFIQYDAATLNAQDDNALLYTYNLSALRDRKTGYVGYSLSFGVIYRGDDWRHYSSVGFTGGTRVEARKIKSDVSSCGRFFGCLYTEIIDAPVPRDRIGEQMKVFHRFGDGYVVSFSEAYIQKLIRAAE